MCATGLKGPEDVKWQNGGVSEDVRSGVTALLGVTGRGDSGSHSTEKQTQPQLGPLGIQGSS